MKHMVKIKMDGNSEILYNFGGRYWEKHLKRFFDIVFSFFLLGGLLPFFILIGIAVKASSKGPIFYRGIRTGYRGAEFQIFKFRTMVENAEMIGGATTGSNDVRVTKIGRFLRKTKIDELPQLINVLLGDMSIVGPRPEVPKYTSQYIGEEKLILEMQPGITDYSSIEFVDLDDRVGDFDPDAFFREHILPRKNELRVFYVKNWSLYNDLKIVIRTIYRVFKRIIQS